MIIIQDCQNVQAFREEIVDSLSSLTKTSFSTDHELHLLVAHSKLPITERSRKLWLAGLTAAEKRYRPALAAPSQPVHAALAPYLIGYLLSGTVICKNELPLELLIHGFTEYPKSRPTCSRKYTLSLIGERSTTIFRGPGLW